MVKKNKEKKGDSCGPQVVDFKTWLLSLLVPDKLWGVNLSPACKDHDDAYELGGDLEAKAEADKRFKRAVYNRVLVGTGSKWKAKVASTLYYLGVHLGGEAHFKWTS